MNYYNIYYRGKKLNNRPINDIEIQAIKEKKEIYKRNELTNNLENIPTNNISIIKTIII